MHPAYSIIFFTTFSGLGYGMLISLGLGAFIPSYSGLKSIYELLPLGLGSTFVVLGLLSSTFHLGNPQRAWRALSQWKTSWLSREGVMAVLTFIPVLFFAYGTLFNAKTWFVSGIIMAIMSLITVFCTAMIYGSLKTVDAWKTLFTPVLYLLFSLVSGAVFVVTLLPLIYGELPKVFYWLILDLFWVPWGVKIAYWIWVDIKKPRSTPESATGLGKWGKVTMLQPPHTGENYLLREMGYQIARKHSFKLRIIAVVLGGVVPFLCLYFLLPYFWVAACISMMVGIVVERWLFFAEARHVVMNYYEG